jgi:hypothetical protein
MSRRVFSPIFFFWSGASGLAPGQQRDPFKKNKNQSREEPMLDAVMIALLFLSALWVLIVLADEIRTSVSGLRRRGFKRKLMQ